MVKKLSKEEIQKAKIISMLLTAAILLGENKSHNKRRKKQNKY
jgi:hypothetical protein